MEELIKELEFYIDENTVNTRLIYRAKAYSCSFEEPVKKDVNQIVEQYEHWLSQGQDRAALEQMGRLIGLLEGIRDLKEPLKEKSPPPEFAPQFELGTKDKDRVVELCIQMRKIILASDIFDQPHKRRLLNRIAGIEHQVQQPKGLLDIVRAGVSDVGETLGKFGTDIEPLTKRMKEVAQIARSNSKEYDQIPAPEEVKQLPKPDDEESSE